jgi:hypothetical protein
VAYDREPAPAAKRRRVEAEGGGGEMADKAESDESDIDASPEKRFSERLSSVYAELVAEGFIDAATGLPFGYKRKRRAFTHSEDLALLAGLIRHGREAAAWPVIRREMTTRRSEEELKQRWESLQQSVKASRYRFQPVVDRVTFLLTGKTPSGDTEIDLSGGAARRPSAKTPASMPSSFQFVCAMCQTLLGAPMEVDCFQCPKCAATFLVVSKQLNPPRVLVKQINLPSNKAAAAPAPAPAPTPAPDAPAAAASASSSASASAPAPVPVPAP